MLFCCLPAMIVGKEAEDTIRLNIYIKETKSPLAVC